MAWRIQGTYYGPCSCRVSCPCELGELVGDQGWCSGLLVFDIQNGSVDGVDVSRTKVVFDGDWPRGFLSGDGTARLYFDEGVSPAQQTALEAVLSGQKGGVFEPISALISSVLPSKKARITIQKSDDEISGKVGDFGEFTTTPLRGATGEYTRLLHGAAAFRDNLILARGTGTRWRDPELRQWEGGGHSEIAEFDWSA